MRASLTIFFVLFFLSAQTQQQKRIIVDKETNKPVSYATVKVLHTNKGEIASVNGEFNIPVTATDTVLITCVGYHDATIMGTEIGNRIALIPRPRILENVTISVKTVIRKFVIGNGAELINKNIKCNYVPGRNNDCMPWGAGAAAEFAEPMTLPDSLKSYRVSKLYIPIEKHGCWQGLFFQVYEKDSAGRPGNLIFRKPVPIESGNYKKGKLSLDLSEDNIYFSKTSHFFISISWDTNFPDTNCVTTLSLTKSQTGISYSRNLQSPEYRWFLFDSNRFESKEGHFRTIFAVEVEELH